MDGCSRNDNESWRDCIPVTINGMEQDTESAIQHLRTALPFRDGMLDTEHRCALRLFNGFYEGILGLAIDIYARTLVIFNQAEPADRVEMLLPGILEFCRQRYAWIESVLLKTRATPDLEARRGILLTGREPDRKVREHGVWYALDLTMNQDASLYLDTRGLRKWLIENTRGKSVLNTFAYSGSLGAAACAGGAQPVVQLDLNRRFLNLGKTTCSLNGFPVRKADFISGDFFACTARFRREGRTFDCVILDPPFFSDTAGGRVDLAANSERLINKVRPLVNDGGILVVINNALYVSGAAWMAALEGLCAEGYTALEALIPAPEDITGFPGTKCGAPPVDTAPFNHSTKIAVLKVRRKISA